jgi:hypothetical protein
VGHLEAAVIDDLISVGIKLSGITVLLLINQAAE